MLAAPCNKCRSGTQPAGVSWCLGCSSLEVSQDFLKKKWGLPGLRGLAEEEAALSGARFVRALYNLDSSLASSSGSAEGRALLTAAKSKAERPRSRSPRDERPTYIPRAPPPPAPPRRGEREPSPESLYSEGEESEEEDQARDAPVKPGKVEEKDKERERRWGATGRLSLDIHEILIDSTEKREERSDEEERNIRGGTGTQRIPLGRVTAV